MDWLAMFLTILGLYLAGNKHNACWPVWIVGNALWIAAMIPQRQGSVVAVNAVFILMNIVGFMKWRRERKHQDAVKARWRDHALSESIDQLLERGVEQP